MVKTKKYIYWAIYAILYCSVIQRYIWANQFCQILPDIIIFSIFFFKKGLIIRNTPKINIILGKWVPRTLILFFAVGIISDIVNLVNPIAVIWGARMLLRYILLFLLVYKNFEAKDLIKLQKIINISFYINSILILYQFTVGVTGDSMGGIWNGNGELSIYIILMTIYFSATYYKKGMPLKSFLFRILFFYITAIWAEIKMLYFFLPICIYGVYILLKSFSIKHIIILIIAWFLAIHLLTQVLSLYYNEEYVSQTLNLEDLQAYNTNNYGFTEESLNRGTIFKKSTLFLDSPVYIAIGHGLGSGNMSSYFSTDLAEQYGKTCYSFFTMSYLLMEVGYTGLILYLAIYFLILYNFFSIYRKTKDQIIKFWATMGVLATAATFLMIYYNSVPLNNYYFGYLFAAICSIGIKERLKYLYATKLAQIKTTNINNNQKKLQSNKNYDS